VPQWGLRARGWFLAFAFDGTPSARLFYTVDLTIGTRRFRRVRVTVSHRTNVLIGRDLLNQLTILHNGPQLRVEIHDA
jgi:hypothetical protein